MSERFKVTLEGNDDGYTFRQILKVVHDGAVLYEESDGGEPEDQSFYRDWRWVPEAIEKAYALGLADGRSSPSEGVDSGNASRRET